MKKEYTGVFSLLQQVLVHERRAKHFTAEYMTT
jgi:hypothetical protein